MLIIILFSLICCLVSIWAYIKITSQINVIVPKLPKALNFIEFGILKFSFNDLYKRIVYMGEFTNENGGVSRFNYGPVTAYVVSEAEDMVTVLNKCTKKIFLYDLIKPYVGSQLVAADFPVWKRNRRLMDLAFKQNILNGYIDIFNEQADRLVASMAEDVNKETDFSSLIGRNFLETTCLTALGIQMKGQEDTVDRYVESVHKVIEATINRVRQPWLILDILFKFSNLKKEQDKSLKIVWDFSEQIIKKKKIELSQQNTKKENYSDEDRGFQSILENLLENRDENELSDIQLRQLIDNVILAAFDTNIPGLLYSLVCIGSYPEVQRKVYEEVMSVTGDRDILKEDLPKLVYLEAAIKEAIRLYPPGIITARTATSDVQLKDYVLPDGCQVVVHYGAVNRNKNHWGQDADEFRPERWFDALPTQYAAFATFSPGKRGCVGKNYAMMKLKITVAKIIKKFYINGNDKNLDLEFIIFLKPTAGHLIKLELRE